MGKIEIEKFVDGLLLDESLLTSSIELINSITPSIDNNLLKIQMKLMGAKPVQISNEVELREKLNLSQQRFQWISVTKTADNRSGAKFTINSFGVITFSIMQDDQVDEQVEEKCLSFVEDAPRLPHHNAARAIFRILMPAMMVIAGLILLLGIFAIDYSNELQRNSVKIAGIKLPSESESLAQLSEALKSTDVNKKLDALIYHKFTSYKPVNLEKLITMKEMAWRWIYYAVAMLFGVILLALIDKFLFPRFALCVGRHRRSVEQLKHWRKAVYALLPIGALIKIAIERL